MRRLLSNGVVVFAGFLAVPPANHTHLATVEATKFSYAEDPRFIRLQAFFQERDCPAQELVGDFLAAADAHKLDWRLLPSISVIESGGGKAYKNNNIFGWDSCRQSFPTISNGIHTVASRLANSRLYRGKNLNEKLETYNPHPGYRERVKYVMRKIGPVELPVNVSLN